MPLDYRPDHERQSHRGRRAVRTSSPPPDNAPGCGLAKYDSNPPQEQQRGVTTASNKKEPPVKGRASGHGRPAVPTSCPKDNSYARFSCFFSSPFFAHQVMLLQNVNGIHQLLLLCK
uniref:Uncharacterized protein n=1 Tax=Ananas comosus var. bracteatus TaxID=296719 RepID=A0A6V7PVF5_ANACO|nr:unnamed protein product [Ananas comosus var. bracteatus]